MKLWIARDLSGELYLYNIKPREYEDYFMEPSGFRSFPLDGNLFPEVAFENSPQEVEIKLVK